MALTSLARVCLAVFIASVADFSVAVEYPWRPSAAGRSYGMPRAWRGASSVRNSGFFDNYHFNPSGGLIKPARGTVTPSGVRVPGVKPVFSWSASMSWSAKSVGRAALRGSKAFMPKFTPAGIVAFAGTWAFFKAVGWYFSDDGELVKPPDTYQFTAFTGVYYESRKHSPFVRFGSARDACIDSFPSARQPGIFSNYVFDHAGPVYQWADYPRYGFKLGQGNCYWRVDKSDVSGELDTRGSYYLTAPISYIEGSCPSGSTYIDWMGGCLLDVSRPAPVAPADFDSLPWDDYRPQPSDLPLITPYLPAPDKITFDPPKPVTLPVETDVHPDGTTTETRTTIQPKIDPPADPATRTPGLTTTTTTIETDFDHGRQTDQRTTTRTTDSIHASEPVDLPAELPPAVDIPTDCDFMPTICKFIDWFKEPPSGADPFEQMPGMVKHPDIAQTYDFALRGARQCPAPMQVSMGLVGTVSVSLDAFCRLAEMLRWFVIASASLTAAFILIGEVRKG